jgi:predicted RNA binding protein YcfA (HicA-like mRNA interferase family)
VKSKPSRPREVERIALSLGFVFDRSKGSHRIYKHRDGRRTVIPFYAGDVATGTLKSIIDDLGITVQEFNARV